MKIYIVEGTTGEYSDRTDWVVCAYRSKVKAETHVRNAMLRAKELQLTRPDQYSEVAEGANQYDPEMRMDYTGTSYHTVKCDLKS